MAKRPKLTTEEKIARLEKNHEKKTPWYRKTKPGTKKKKVKLSMF